MGCAAFEANCQFPDARRSVCAVRILFVFNQLAVKNGLRQIRHPVSRTVADPDGARQFQRAVLDHRIFQRDDFGALRRGISLSSDHVQSVGRGFATALGGSFIDGIVLRIGARRAADGSCVIRIGGVVSGGETARRIAAVHCASFMLQRIDAFASVAF